MGIQRETPPPRSMPCARTTISQSLQFPQDVFVLLCCRLLLLLHLLIVVLFSFFMPLLTYTTTPPPMMMISEALIIVITLYIDAARSDSTTEKRKRKESSQLFDNNLTKSVDYHCYRVRPFVPALVALFIIPGDYIRPFNFRRGVAEAVDWK